MEHLSNDHEDCPNQHKNSHKLCDETKICIKCVQIKILYDNVQTVQNLYKCMFFVHSYKLCTNYTYKTYTTSELRQPLYVFHTYTQCTNYTKCIHMSIKSYMQLLMYVFCINKNPTFFTFQIFALTATPSSILFPPIFKSANIGRLTFLIQFSRLDIHKKSTKNKGFQCAVTWSKTLDIKSK